MKVKENVVVANKLAEPSACARALWAAKLLGMFLVPCAVCLAAGAFLAKAAL
jgi:hypothetical protein